MQHPRKCSWILKRKMMKLCLPLLLVFAAAAHGSSWIDKYSISYDHMINSSAAFPPSWQGMPLGDGSGVAAMTYMDGPQLGLLIGKVCRSQRLVPPIQLTCCYSPTQSDAYDEFHELIKVTLDLCG